MSEERLRFDRILATVARWGKALIVFGCTGFIGFAIGFWHAGRSHETQLAECESALRRPAPPPAVTEDAKTLIAVRQELSDEKRTLAACEQKLVDTNEAWIVSSNEAQRLDLRLKELTVARASARSQHPSLLLRPGMQVSEVDDALGIARDSEMQTCGSKTPQPWTCMIRRYCTAKGCVRVTFEQSGSAWYVNSWSKSFGGY
jgi:hypothetical protein